MVVFMRILFGERRLSLPAIRLSVRSKLAGIEARRGQRGAHEGPKGPPRRRIAVKGEELAARSGDRQIEVLFCPVQV